MEQARVTAEKAAERIDGTGVEPSPPPNIWVWTAIVLAALVIGSVAAFYLWRM